jgi:hypothetical protein
MFNSCTPVWSIREPDDERMRAETHFRLVQRRIGSAFDCERMRLGRDSDLESGPNNVRQAIRQKLRRPTLRISVAVVALLIGHRLLPLPPRNLYGRPSAETVLDTCSFAPGAPFTVRAFEGDAGGATEPPTYSVTVRGRYWPIERQFFFSFELPRIVAVRCLSGGYVQIISQSATYVFSLRSIVATLIWQPIYYSEGQARTSTLLPIVAYLGQVLGLLSIGAGLYFYASMLWRR